MSLSVSSPHSVDPRRSSRARATEQTLFWTWQLMKGHVKLAIFVEKKLLQSQLKLSFSFDNFHLSLPKILYSNLAYSCSDDFKNSLLCSEMFLTNIIFVKFMG